MASAGEVLVFPTDAYNVRYPSIWQHIVEKNNTMGIESRTPSQAECQTMKLCETCSNFNIHDFEDGFEERYHDAAVLRIGASKACCFCRTMTQAFNKHYGPLFIAWKIIVS